MHNHTGRICLYFFPLCIFKKEQPAHLPSWITHLRQRSHLPPSQLLPSFRFYNLSCRASVWVVEHQWSHIKQLLWISHLLLLAITNIISTISVIMTLIREGDKRKNGPFSKSFTMKGGRAKNNKTMELFFTSCFCWCVPVCSWTPKTCFALGLECLCHIYSS